MALPPLKPDPPATGGTLGYWLTRELPVPEPICGTWLTKTSRVLLWAPTGIGKTLLALALGVWRANGLPFLHWPEANGRKMRVLYIDGEMSSRLLKERLVDESKRLGIEPDPDTFVAASWEDIPNFQPLNTPAGQRAINKMIHLHKPDLIIFDNIMSLLSGNMKETEQWDAVKPWVKSLTKHKIAQLWIHHSGHDETRAYGDKTKEWIMDTVMSLERVERPDTDVSFLLSFKGKKRECKPSNRHEFADVRIALVDDKWVHDAKPVAKRKKLDGEIEKFYEALLRAARTSKTKQRKDQPTATVDEWSRECVTMGVLESTERGPMKTFYSYRKRLVGANWVACNDKLAWSVVPLTEAERQEMQKQMEIELEDVF
jgi:hypothetical protein